MNPLIKIVKTCIEQGSKIIPLFIRNKINTGKYANIRFMQFAASEIKPQALILDAGAGPQPYKSYFSHTNYESTDCEYVFHKAAKNSLTFICSLDNIPKPDNHYDAIICTEVLEHVEYPQQVLHEFYRILKPGGKLFLTTPFIQGVHGEPYHFYNFTPFGLTSLFKNARFSIEFIRPHGGIFVCIGNLIRLLPIAVLCQYLFKRIDGEMKFKPRLGAIFLTPIFIVLLPIYGFVLPFLLYFLDKVDKKKDFTLGYSCYCNKKLDSKAKNVE